MTNDELSNLLDCIKIEVNNDAQVGVKKTEFKLPKEALDSDAVLDVLPEHFEHYDSCTIEGGYLILVHPEID